ncbi:ABC transporter ATP-binding protein [uncultured Vagococcus sp.]|uniref:ABC transporter ATP-binding protein n=1 Tax=uncultured Vagococcus sp. TaxID=189676 RepID=UPI0028D8F5FF|nr:ABC transporter ATP-binding protein [uncultured Vagococcus sp.]
MITIKNLKKQFTNTIILDNISLEIKVGSKTIILGESGSGKSTLLNLIAGFDLPDSGELIVGSKDIAKMNEEKRTEYRRGKIGFVFQDFMLFDDLTVEENLRMGAKFNRKKLDKTETKDLIDNTLSLLGLTEKKDYYPEQLSGGQKQRVAIGRSLCTEPEYILADEPTGALDSANEEKVLRIFDIINEKYGTTLILVTHSQRVAQIADEIIYIADGKIYEK